MIDGRSQPDELAKICEVMGSPGGEVWPEGQRLAAAMGFSFPQAQQQVREQSAHAVGQLLGSMLHALQPVHARQQACMPDAIGCWDPVTLRTSIPTWPAAPLKASLRPLHV